MNKINLVLIFASRLCLREWRRFVLPFLSLFVTAVVLSLTLLLTSASGLLLTNQAQELLGGDVVIESFLPIDETVFGEAFGQAPSKKTAQTSFTATIESVATAAAVSARVIDMSFPLYGVVGLRDGLYQYPQSDQLLIDSTTAEQLMVEVGDSLTVGQASYVVAGILVAEPTSLLTNFRFLPRIYMSTEGFARSLLDLNLLRPEYSIAYAVDAITKAEAEALMNIETDTNSLYRVKLASTESGGLQAGLGLVRDFLIVAVLITAILATVNIYASTVYFVTTERKSFAVMLAIGLTGWRLVGVLGLALFYVSMVASTAGALSGIFLFRTLRALVEKQFLISLPYPDFVPLLGFTILFLILIVVAAFTPTIRQLLLLKPKVVLAGDTDEQIRTKPLTLLLVTMVAISPLLLASSWLLSSITRGVAIVLGVMLVYVAIASIFSAVLGFWYRRRYNYGFAIRSVLAYKQADGLFGIISFTSLFAALAAFCTLLFLQASLVNYLTNNLAETVPTTYVIDVQPSQKEDLVKSFPELTLFSNTPARIIAIDGVDIQAAIAQGNEDIDRELGREFNVTARPELLTSEQLTVGQPWRGTPGELSVDEDFAKRANIELGSALVFSIQGFTVEGVVTSLRKTDDRSGLPFFYFIFAPADLAPFPVVYFGYTYQAEAAQTELARYLASTMPNVSIIKTQAVAPLLTQITKLLLLVILVVAIPPLLIAGILIVTLIISSYAMRRMEGARLRALGASTNQVLIQYLLESSILAISASILAYLGGAAVSAALVHFFFKLEAAVWLSGTLITVLFFIVLVVLIIGTYLFKSDKIKLRELLSYGDN